MFHGVPLGSSGWKVADRYRQVKRIGQILLQMGFPGASSATVAASGIAQEQQMVFPRVSLLAFRIPPMGKRRHCKGGCIVGDADANMPLFSRWIVKTVGNRKCGGILTEVMAIDLFPFLPPRAARMGEIAYEFLLLRIYA